MRGLVKYGEFLYEKRQNPGVNLCNPGLRWREYSPLFQAGIPNRQRFSGKSDGQGVSRMKPSTPVQEKHAATGLARLYYLNILANLAGIVVIVVLNFFTPLEFFVMQRAFILHEGGWVILVFFWPLILCVGLLIQYRLLCPLRDMRGALSEGVERVPEEILRKVMRRLLNLPVVTALTTLAMWILIPALVVTLFRILWGTSVLGCLFLFFRTFMIGLIAANLVFFLLENHLRKTWVPLVFPAGKLASVPGTVRIPVMRRIRVLYGAGTVNPMLLLVGTLLFTLGDTGLSSLSATDLSRAIFLFALVLCGLFVVIALGLNSLVLKSILQPVAEMMRALKMVKNGNFTGRIRVVSNDELGILGDAGNDMIAGLADRERIRETFGRYVTPEIRDRILEGRIPADGERRVATVLFSDLRGFTPYVEENSPEEVVKSMRAYFTLMQKAIRNRRGLVLQYVGDGIEAAFGAPVPCEDHADQAVMAALDMRKALEEFNREREARGKAPFRQGIGVHTGLVLAGNTGSEDHLSYALIGETVNVAARVQDLTKKFPCDILITEETAGTLTAAVRLEKETPVMVKGYSRPVTVYRVMGW